MKEYQIVIRVHWTNGKMEADWDNFHAEDKEFDVNADSFIAATGDAMRIVGKLDELWHEHWHEVVSVRLLK